MYRGSLYRGSTVHVCRILGFYSEHVYTIIGHVSKLRHNYKRLPSRLCITKKLKMPKWGKISRYIRYRWHFKQVNIYKMRKVLRIILQTDQCGKRTLTSLSLDIYSQIATLFVNSIRRKEPKKPFL